MNNAHYQKVYISFLTIIRREWLRMIRIAGQVFLPPVITMTLYFLIFGSLIGNRIGLIHDVPYPYYIAPGLIIMTVINNAYSNVSSSFFSNRFQKNIEELLISPTPNCVILFGYVLGGVVRSFVVGFLVCMIAFCFIPFQIHNLPLMLFITLLVSMFFAQAGFTNALLARNFDDVMLIPTFILTPLTYLGGVFYSTNMLSDFWRTVSFYNPILHMVNIFRHSMIGISDTPIGTALIVIVFATLAITSLNLYLLNKGIGLKE
jgi:ABC-2 type transport system permease protein